MKFFSNDKDEYSNKLNWALGSFGQFGWIKKGIIWSKVYCPNRTSKSFNPAVISAQLLSVQISNTWG